MRRPLTDREFHEAMRAFRSTAFRLELQSAYAEPVEHEAFANYLARHPDHPPDVPALAEWFAEVAQMAREGRRIERVRVQDEPPTDYQWWERFVGRWNIEAGEVIHYLPRSVATAVGLLPAAGPDDWWLLDSSQLIVMHFDDQHRRTGSELVTDREDVQRALGWRDLAVRTATGTGPVAAA